MFMETMNWCVSFLLLFTLLGGVEAGIPRVKGHSNTYGSCRKYIEDVRQINGLNPLNYKEKNEEMIRRWFSGKEGCSEGDKPTGFLLPHSELKGLMIKDANEQVLKALTTQKSIGVSCLVAHCGGRQFLHLFLEFSNDQDRDDVFEKKWMNEQSSNSFKLPGGHGIPEFTGAEDLRKFLPPISPRAQRRLRRMNDRDGYKHMNDKDRRYYRENTLYNMNKYGLTLNDVRQKWIEHGYSNEYVDFWFEELGLGDGNADGSDDTYYKRYDEFYDRDYILRTMKYYGYTVDDMRRIMREKDLSEDEIASKLEWLGLKDGSTNGSKGGIKKIGENQGDGDRKSQHGPNRNSQIGTRGNSQFASGITPTPATSTSKTMYSFLSVLVIVLYLLF